VNLSGRMIHTIYVAAYSGVDGSGQSTYATKRAVKCRVESAFATVRSPDGTQIEVNHKIVTYEAIGQQDRIWLPGADSTLTRASKRPAAIASATPLAGGQTLYEIAL